MFSTLPSFRQHEKCTRQDPLRSRCAGFSLSHLAAVCPLFNQSAVHTSVNPIAFARRPVAAKAVARRVAIGGVCCDRLFRHCGGFPAGSGASHHRDSPARGRQLPGRSRPVRRGLRGSHDRPPELRCLRGGLQPLGSVSGWSVRQCLRRRAHAVFYWLFYGDQRPAKLRRLWKRMRRGRVLFGRRVQRFLPAYRLHRCGGSRVCRSAKPRRALRSLRCGVWYRPGVSRRSMPPRLHSPTFDLPRSVRRPGRGRDELWCLWQHMPSGSQLHFGTVPVCLRQHPVPRPLRGSER
jgi:hypothetical protein